MEEQIDSLSQDFDLPATYNFAPLTALTLASREKLSGYLDLDGVLIVANFEGIETDILNDYMGLAELAGFNYLDIMNMKKQRSPTTELLNRWADQNGTVGKLWKYLYVMERHDVLTDCRKFILQDCSVYEEQRLDKERCKIEQDPTAVSYDAFICYTVEDENDHKFLYKMIGELEDKRGLRLFVPGRDDLPGSTITAYFIEERCKRVVILMSKTFLQSAACDFIVRFADVLSLGTKNCYKFIPAVLESDTQVPSILQMLAVCDFTQANFVEWHWERIYRTTLQPIEDSSNSLYMNECLKTIIFPAHRRLGKHTKSSNWSEVDRWM